MYRGMGHNSFFFPVLLKDAFCHIISIIRAIVTNILIAQFVAFYPAYIDGSKDVHVCNYELEFKISLF